jgi:arylsulfatase A-like enzyme
MPDPGAAPVRNILFIMCDQLRADYLACAGHPTIRTPAIDALAARGVRFSRAYCQAPVCGPSRMSFYTGRYAFSHRASYNNVPLRIDEMTMGDHLRPLGLRTALVGKTHMAADRAGMQRLGISGVSEAGILAAQCGFEPFERDDGLHPEQSLDPDLHYNRFLREHGHDGDNPWHDWANAAEGPDGDILSGWHMRHANLPARVPEPLSETAWMTDRAMDFIRDAGEERWCLHLSYIKPHWPYIAPAPYHERYRAADIPAAIRSDAERADPHPVVAAFMQHEESLNFARDEVRERVIPAYMGLIEQIDDHIARLMTFLGEQGRFNDTMIVFTSDHGDYLGDHWLGEKELFHEASAAIPMIVVDPRSSADATRGTVSDALVEAIDLAPTFVEAAGGELGSPWLEGRSLMPLLRGEEVTDWRDAVFAEADYAWRHARLNLGLAADAARAWMVCDGQWKFIWYQGFRPQLFNLADDPGELSDLGDDPDYEAVRRRMKDRLFDWFAARGGRVTISDREVNNRAGKARERGYLFGLW